MFRKQFYLSTSEEREFRDLESLSPLSISILKKLILHQCTKGTLVHWLKMVKVTHVLRICPYDKIKIVPHLPLEKYEMIKKKAY